MYRLTQRRHDCSAQSRSVSAFIGSLAAIIAFAATTANAAPRLNPEHVLRQWAEASQAIVAVGKSAQQRAFHEYNGQFNGHQIALTNEFRGPVEADELLKRYRFTEVKRDGQVFQLVGLPRDDVEQLFVKGFEVTFSDDSFLPISMQFLDTKGQPQRDEIALLTSKPQPVTAVFDRTAVKRNQAGVRVASAIENAATNRVQQADVEFPTKRAEDSKRLQEVLNKWKANSIRTNTMWSEFRRWEYDHVFHTEKRSKGRLAFRAPQRARIDIEPSKLSVGTSSEMRDKQGNPYHVEEGGMGETLIWWKDHCCQVSHKLAQIDVYKKSHTPAANGKASSWGGWDQLYFSMFDMMLPVFGGWSADLETDYEWSLVKDSSTRLQLKGVPQTKKSKQNIEEIAINLDSQSYRVRAVKFVRPGRKSETVYSLYDHTRNVDGDRVEFVDLMRFAAPELPGYRTIKHGQ